MIESKILENEVGARDKRIAQSAWRIAKKQEALGVRRKDKSIEHRA